MAEEPVLHAMSQKPSLKTILILAAAAIILLGISIYYAYVSYPMAVMGTDWKQIGASIRNGHVTWGGGMYNPPWGVLFLMPLGFLPLEVGWAILIALTFVVVFLCVPKDTSRRNLLLLLLAGLFSYFTVFTISGGNLDTLVVLGLMLSIWAYQHDRPFLLAAASLLATIKPQVVFLFYIALGVVILKTKSRDFIIRFGAAVVGVILLSMVWEGRGWLDSILSYRVEFQRWGISFPSICLTFGCPDALVWFVRVAVAGAAIYSVLRSRTPVDRINTGLLCAASCFVANYAGGVSLMVIQLVAMLPFTLRRPVRGGIAHLLMFFPLITAAFTPRMIFGYPDNFFHSFILIYCLIVLFIEVMAARSRQDAELAP